MPDEPRRSRRRQTPEKLAESILHLSNKIYDSGPETGAGIAIPTLHDSSTQLRHSLESRPPEILSRVIRVYYIW